VIWDFAYDDKHPWPVVGDGASIVLNNPISQPAPDLAVGSNWRASPSLVGAPGESDSVNFTLVPGGDDDTDGVGGVRSLSGEGNNVDHPEFGAADQPFIRLTDARYGEPDANGNRAINPIFDGLDPRAISNTLGAQEASLPTSAADANIFFMAFGQYFDHGLDFLPKSSANGMIEIGGHDVSDIAPEHRGVGMAFQNFALFPHMNASENIATPLRAAGADESKVKAGVAKVAKLLKIDHVLELNVVNAMALALVQMVPLLIKSK
jgi:hypothetical protein